MRGTKPTPTLLQKRFIAIFKKNAMSGSTKGMKDMLREAGYSEASVVQYTNTMEGIRPHIDPFIEKMEAQRERAIKRMEETVDQASYADVTRAVDVLTSGIRLLTGKTT